MSGLGLIYPFVPPGRILAAVSLSLAHTKCFILATTTGFELYDLKAANFASSGKQVFTGFWPSAVHAFRPQGSESDWIAVLDGNVLKLVQIDDDLKLHVRYKFATPLQETDRHDPSKLISVDPSGTQILAHIGEGQYLFVTFTSVTQSPRCKTVVINHDSPGSIAWLNQSQVVLSSLDTPTNCVIGEVTGKRAFKDFSDIFDSKDSLTLYSGVESFYALTRRNIFVVTKTNNRIIHSFESDIVASAAYESWIYVALSSGELLKVSVSSSERVFITTFFPCLKHISVLDDNLVFCHDILGSRVVLNGDEVVFEKSLLTKISGLDSSVDRNGHQHFSVVQSDENASKLSQVNLFCPVQIVSTAEVGANRMFLWRGKLLTSGISGSHLFDFSTSCLQPVKERIPEDEIFAVSDNIFVTSTGVIVDNKKVLEQEFECASIHKGVIFGGAGDTLVEYDSVGGKLTTTKIENSVYSVLATDQHKFYSTMEHLYIDSSRIDLERCSQLLMYQNKLVACHPSGQVTFLSLKGEILEKYVVGKFVTATLTDDGLLLVGTGSAAIVKLTKWGLIAKRLNSLPEGSSIVKLDRDLYSMGGKNITLFKIDYDRVYASITNQKLLSSNARGIYHNGVGTWLTIVNRGVNEGASVKLVETNILGESKQFEVEGVTGEAVGLISLDRSAAGFNAVILAINDQSPFNMDGGEKSTLVLFDIDHKIVLDTKVVQGDNGQDGILTAIKHLRGSNFLVAVDGFVQHWSLQTKGDTPHLELRTPLATVGNIVSSMDYSKGFLLVADSIKAVSMAKVGKGLDRDIMSCPSIKWPLDGIILNETPSALVSTLDYEYHVLMPDKTSPGGLASTLKFEIGQLTTFSTRSGYKRYLDLTEAKSQVLRDIAPDVYFGTDSGGIYGFKLLTGDITEKFELIKQQLSTLGPVAEVIDASHILINADKIKGVFHDSIDWYDELIYALEKLYT